MFCKNCGSELSQDTKFCPVCGMRQDAAPTASPQTYHEPQSAPSSRAVPKKKLSLIPILAAVLALAVAFIAFSALSGNSEKKQKQELLETYIDDDLKELEELKDQIVKKLDSTFFDPDLDLDGVAKRLKEINKLCADLTLKVLDINNSLVNDSEFAKVNGLYVAFAKKASDAVDYLITALENDDGGPEAKQEFLDLLEEADKKYSQLQKELAELAEERDVSYKENRELPFEDLIEEIENIH